MMNRGASDQIHRRFAQWRGAIHSRFEALRRRIRDFTEIVYTLVWELARTIVCAIRELVHASGTVVQLVLLVMALLLLSLFGFELGGITGWVLGIGVISIAPMLVIFGRSSKGRALEKEEHETDGNRPFVTVTGVIIGLLLVAIVSFSVYFEKHSPRLAMTAGLYDFYIHARCVFARGQKTKVALRPFTQVNTHLEVARSGRLYLWLTDSAVISVEDEDREVLVGMFAAGHDSLVAPCDGSVLVESLSRPVTASLSLPGKH